MLAVSSMPCTTDEARQVEAQPSCFMDDFDFTIDGDLLDDIDFSDIFQKFDDESLPDLEVDPADILAEFSVDREETTPVDCYEETILVTNEESCNKADENNVDLIDIVKDDDVACHAGDDKSSSSSSGEAENKQKSGGAAKSSQGKKKAKVDWTPELHRRFVQAVEQLGVDKAVPSRILELMGIDSLTRHNIASHLQKYRSHRKHLLAREAEAANWSQRRQIYAAAGCGAKRVMNTWFPPTVGFPPPLCNLIGLCMFGATRVWILQWCLCGRLHNRPLRLGLLIHLSRKLQILPFGPTILGANHMQLRKDLPVLLSQWQHQGFLSPMVPSVMAHPIYRPIPPPASANKSTSSQVPDNAHPSKDSIDAVIGDVLDKPWLPLPLGLKAPSTESVMVELQRQGISKVPPSNC